MKLIKLAALSVILSSSLANAKIFRNAYISFEMPESWNCNLEQTEWVCRSEQGKEAKEAIIILTAKEVGPTDSLALYEGHLNTPMALQLRGREPERMIQVGWGTEPVKTYPVDILVRAYDRSGLISDISQVLLNEKMNVVALQTSTSKEDNTATLNLTVEVPGLDELGRLLGRISQLPNIIEVRRQRH